MNISIVIPNYNGRDLLQENIPVVVEALLQYPSSQRELLVIDDGSKDDSMDVLSALVKKYEGQDFIFTVIKNGVNQGFSPTVNRGVSQAKGDIVILLNSDVRPYKEFLMPLLSHFTDKNIFAVGCADESIEHGKTVIRGRGVGTWKRGLLVHRKGSNERSDTLWVSGGSGAYRKKTWQELGGLDPLYAPFYWEDIDLSYRAQKAGYSVLFAPQSRVIHEHEKGAIKTGFKARRVQIVSYRNQFIFCWKNMTDKSLLLKHVAWFPVHILSAIRRRDSAFFVGVFHALLRLGKITKTRRKVQSIVTKSDAEVVRRYS